MLWSVVGPVVRSGVVPIRLCEWGLHCDQHLPLLQRLDGRYVHDACVPRGLREWRVLVVEHLRLLCGLVRRGMQQSRVLARLPEWGHVHIGGRLRVPVGLCRLDVLGGHVHAVLRAGLVHGAEYMHLQYRL